MIALAGLAANFVVGLCIWLNINKPLPFNLSFLQLHKITGYTATAGVLIHILLLPLDPLSKFTWADILLPIWTEHQPIANTLGAAALYLIGIVVISSYYKTKISLNTWRALHFLSYFASVPLILHSIIMDPKLQDRPIDWFDAEKLFVILCCGVICTLTIYRFFFVKKA